MVHHKNYESNKWKPGDRGVETFPVMSRNVILIGFVYFIASHRGLVTTHLRHSKQKYWAIFSIHILYLYPMVGLRLAGIP